MVIHESFVTRKPLEFTFIVLSIIFVLLLPVYLYTRERAEDKTVTDVIIPETYSETNYFFSPDSDLSESDKRQLFKIKYEKKFVQWTGSLRACEPRSGLFTVSIDQRGEDNSDVLFTTQDDCTKIPIGSQVAYKTMLIDWKIRTFIGKDGAIISWA